VQELPLTPPLSGPCIWCMAGDIAVGLAPLREIQTEGGGREGEGMAKREEDYVDVVVVAGAHEGGDEVAVSQLLHVHAPRVLSHYHALQLQQQLQQPPPSPQQGVCVVVRVLRECLIEFGTMQVNILKSQSATQFAIHYDKISHF